MKSYVLLPALKYGLLAGALIALFAMLKYTWLLSYVHPDLYLTLVAIFFASIGFWVLRPLRREENRDIFVPAKGSSIDVLPFLDELSRRELEVLQLLKGNLTNKEIADQLCISLSTLKTHINHIYHKAGVKNRKQLISLIPSV